MYVTAVAFTKSIPEIQREVVAVNNVVLMQYGGASQKTDQQGTFESADLYFVVKGSNRFKDLNLYMQKVPDMDWKIEVVGR